MFLYMYIVKALIREIYRVKCKRKTPYLSIRYTTTKNYRSVVKGECEICGTTKNCFTKSKAGGKLDIHWLIGKLPKPKAGWTPTNYKYMGPFNPLDKQLEIDPETGEITKWIVPSFLTRLIRFLHIMMYVIQEALIKTNVLEKWLLNWIRFLMVSCQKWVCLLEKLSTPNKNLD